MKDIHEVLKRKQTRYALLGKQIEMLQQAAEKLREVAPLLAENEEEDDSAVLSDIDDQPSSMAAKASSSQATTAATPTKPARGIAPRWP